MPQVLLEELSPHGNVQAVVEADENACFFYLYGEKDSGFGVRSVWVCNLTAAPDGLDRAAMVDGRAPMNPRAHCAHPQGTALPKPADLRVVWLPEGDGAALYERDELSAIIPPWSGIKGFHGYARDCVGEGPLAWQLHPDNALIERFHQAERYWEAWADESTSSKLQTVLCDRVEQALGKRSNYYAVDGGRWPPKAVVRIPRANGVALVTIGVCARPQPRVELAVDAPAGLRRIELGVVLSEAWPEDAVRRFISYLSAQSALPWSRQTWLGPGHTIPCDSWWNARFGFAALTHDHPEAGALTLGQHFGDPVSVLWFIPLTLAERDEAERDGTEAVLRALPADQWQEA